MGPLLWIIAGAFLGWWLDVIGGRGRWRRARAQAQAQAQAGTQAQDAAPAQTADGWPTLVGFIAGALIELYMRASQADQRQDRPESRMDTWPHAAQVLAWTLFFAFLVGLIVLAGGHHFDLLPSWVYATEEFLLDTRILSLAAGMAIGFWASRYREGIGARSDDFYEAMLGTEHKSSWALQSAVAILAVLGIILALRPDILEHLESLKAGEVEAKFSEISGVTREAVHVSLDDLTKQVGIVQWIDFQKYYSANSPRELALKFDSSIIQLERKTIRDTLFNNYLVPMAELLNCLRKAGRIDRAIRSDSFIAIATDLRSRILNEDGTGRSFRDWKILVLSLEEELNKTRSFVTALPKNIRQDCQFEEKIKAYDMKIYEREDAPEQLSDALTSAILKLESSREESRYSLSFIDPYLVSAVSDVVALIFGHTEKAQFLTLLKSKYPTDLSLIQPGIINLYYQLADAKLKSEATWPLDEITEELDQAMNGAEFIIRQAKINFSNADYIPIARIYLTNKFVFTTTFIQIFYQKALAGNVLSKPDLHKWASSYKQAEQILNLTGIGTQLAGLDADAPALSQEDYAIWRSIRIPGQFLFDARVGMALSSILLTEKNHKASAQACATAHFHLQSAKEMLTPVSGDVISQFGKDLELNPADLTRLRGYLLQVGARIDASCERI